MKKIIVTGCNGQLGRAVNQQYAGSTEYELVNTDVAELDITRVDKVLELAREVKPYAIINCAAYTNVDKCEVEQIWLIRSMPSEPATWPSRRQTPARSSCTFPQTMYSRATCPPIR